MKLAVFDFDSTLMDGETIDELARDFGVNDEVSAITKKAMNGELDFFSSLSARVKLLRGMELSRAKYVCEHLPLINGAKEIVKKLHEMDYKVVCFSGGFTLATAHFREILNLDSDFSNVLHEENGILSGKVGGAMMFGDSKGEMLKRLKKILKPQKTIAVGDGANDLSMFPFADIKIAFCAKDVLKKEADIIIEQKNLLEILSFIKE